MKRVRHSRYVIRRDVDRYSYASLDYTHIEVKWTLSWREHFVTSFSVDDFIADGSVAAAAAAAAFGMLDMFNSDALEVELSVESLILFS